MSAFKTISVAKNGGCATIEFTSPLLVHKDGEALRPGRHRELGMALDQLRFENDIRVIVITGKDDVFCMTGDNHPHFHGHTPDRTWGGLQALRHVFQQVIEIEKPIIAKVNGGVK